MEGTANGVVDFRTTWSEVDALLGIRSHTTMVSVLCWVRCLGHSVEALQFEQPRTGEQCKTPGNDVLYVATGEHLGGAKPWFFGKSQLGIGALGEWKGHLNKLNPNEEAILLLRAERRAWELTDEITLVMGKNRVQLDPAKHVLIQSLDPKGGLSFVPFHCVSGENPCAELFPGLVFKTKFERGHRLIFPLIPDEFIADL